MALLQGANYGECGACPVGATSLGVSLGGVEAVAGQQTAAYQMCIALREVAIVVFSIMEISCGATTGGTIDDEGVPVAGVFTRLVPILYANADGVVRGHSRETDTKRAIPHRARHRRRTRPRRS